MVCSPNTGMSSKTKPPPRSRKAGCPCSATPSHTGLTRSPRPHRNPRHRRQRAESASLDNRASVRVPTQTWRRTSLYRYEPHRISKTSRCRCFPPRSGAASACPNPDASKAALCLRVVRTTGGLVHIGARRAYCNDCRLHGTGQLPWTGNTSDRGHRYRENVVAAARPRPVHSWDTDMDPGIDLALARQRLLDAADELFYRQGMHRVSIDRVIEKAGVPPETLREAFGGTDELVRAYLRARHTRLQDALARDLPGYRTPRERLVGVFEIQGRSFVEPGFRGCALVTASAEALPGEVVEEVVTEYRDWIHNMFFDMAFAAEVTHPEELAEQLVVLFDGAGISAWLDAKPSTVNTTRAVAEALVDAALRS